MKRAKKLISLVLVFAFLMSLMIVSGFAVVRSTFSVGLSATSDYDGNSAITYAKKGEKFYLRINFSGNSEENNIGNFDLFISYDKSLITIDNDAIYGEGPSTSVVHSVDVRRDGVVALAWADTNGFQEGSGPNRRPPESGTIAVITCVANEDLDTSDFASFNIVDDGELDTFFDTINNQEVTVAISNLTLPVLVPSSVLIYTEESEVAAPYAGWDSTALEPTPGTTSFEYEVLATDDEGNIISSPTVTWAIDGNPAGVSVENGIVTIDSTTAAGEYTVKATVGEQSAESKFTVTKETSVPTNIVGDQPGAEFYTNLYIPADNGESNTVQFSGKVWDQYGVAMSSDLLDWKLEPSDIAGVSIGDNGLLTITNEAKGAITDTTGKQFIVKGTCGEMSLTTAITVKRAAPVATSVAIYKDGGESAIESDTIAIPQGGSTSVTYTAAVLDQYGEVMSGETATWAEPIDLPTNVTFDTTSGKLTVPAGENTGTGNVTLTASCGSASGTVTINIAKISFTVEQGAVTTASNPVYGMTWGDIVKVTGEISANVGSTSVEGEYSVKDADTKPDAGEQTYTIVFNASGYNDVTVYTGTVTIAPQAVTVEGITASSKEYDGDTEAVVSTEGAVVSIEGVTVTSAAGTFADANVGTDKTVTVEVTLSDDNYTVEDLELKASITPKTLTVGVTNVDVSKVYDGTTDPGTVTGSASATGTVAGETVTVNVTAGEYPGKDVKSDYTVELTLELTGDAAKNYVLNSTTATISDAAITACDEFTDATSKTQNVVVGVGTFTAPSFTGVTVNGTPEAVDGEVTYSYSNGETSITKGSYDDIVTALKALKKDASAEINYKFTASGNYTGEITGTISVTMVDILFTVDGETANAKNALDIDTNAVYGETWADIVTIKSGINATLNERPVEGTYQLSVNTTDRPTAGNHSFELQFVSGGKIYKVCDATVNVAKREVSISGGLSVTSKQYDGTANATVTGTAALSNVFGTDNVGLTYTGGTFESKNAGTHNVTLIDATLIGDDKDNYTLSNNYTLTGTIDKRPVTVTDGLSVTGKEYDGTTRADIVNSATFDNVVTGESLTLTFTGANFASADVGTHDVTLTGVALGGDYAANYELTGNLPALSGTISKATYSPAPSLNINIVTNQAAAQTGTLTALNFFGGSTPADATITAVGSAKGTVISGISVANGTLTYTSAANITAEGTTETYKVTISTRNYNDITATLTFTTVAKTPVTISDVSVADKVYNGQAVSYIGTPTAAANGETVEVSAYTYTWQNAEGNVLSAAPVNAGSYKLVIAVAADDPNYVGSATVSFTISKATVTVTVDDKEAYVGSDMPELTYTVSGLASGESLAVNPTLTCNADMDKPGEYAITASGAAVPATGNYNETITYVPGTLTVSRRPINVGPTYDIDVVDSDNGSVKASLGNASEGSVITLTVTPDDGYKLGSITVIDENGDEVEVRRSGSEYKFTMPDSDVRVSARFVRDTGALPFNDVNAGDWFYDYVEYVYNNGIMDGVDNGVFSPNTETTRGMVVTILYRLAGEPNVRGGNDFSDVASGAYYADAVTWASNAGIVNGTSATTFSPNALVTREQFAAMLYRYMSYIGEDVSASTNLNRYTDAGSVSAYAETAMSWAVAEGIINGRTATTLAPAGNCTRAEVAAMITRVFG